MLSVGSNKPACHTWSESRQARRTAARANSHCYGPCAAKTWTSSMACMQAARLKLASPYTRANAPDGLASPPLRSAASAMRPRGGVAGRASMSDAGSGSGTDAGSAADPVQGAGGCSICRRPRLCVQLPVAPLRTPHRSSRAARRRCVRGRRLPSCQGHGKLPGARSGRLPSCAALPAAVSRHKLPAPLSAAPLSADVRTAPCRACLLCAVSAEG